MWIDLRSDVEALFSCLAVYVPVADGTRFFRPEESADVVSRVARWRIANRERRNQTARAKNADERASRAAYQRAWQAKRKGKLS